jgi:hypothetical protein
VDTLKSLAVVTLLGAVLYGVYVVASKPEKPLSPDVAARLQDAEGPLLIEQGVQVADGVHGLAPEVIFQDRPRSGQSTAPRRADIDAFDSAYGPGGSSYDSQADYRPTDAEAAAPGGRRASHAYDGFTPPGEPFSATRAGDPSVNSTPYGRDEAFALPEPGGTGDREPKTSSAVQDAELEASRQRARRYAYQQVKRTAQEQCDQGRYREALTALSAFYRDAALDSRDQEELGGWLDALAARVIYSTDHLLEPAYTVSRSDTLYSIANKYEVPYLLLKNINAVRDPEVLVPGTKLKVLRGPFRADVDLKRSELTLFVQNLYAGRFPFTRGNEPVKPGEYRVVSKTQQKDYHGPQGKIAHNDPRNPYGGVWIDLGGGMGLHGSPAEAYEDASVGCLSLAQRDAEDLFAILSDKESIVLVRE